MRGEKNGNFIFRKRRKQTETQKPFKANVLSEIVAVERMKGAQILRRLRVFLSWYGLIWKKYFLHPESVKKWFCFINIYSSIVGQNRR